MEYHKFKKEFLGNIYSPKFISESTIQSDYNIFKEGVGDAHEIAVNILKELGKDINVDEFIDVLSGEDGIDDYNGAILDSMLNFLDENYETYTIDEDGCCLKRNLIGRACQMRHDEEMLGVVRDYDKEKPNMLFVDFGDPQEIKIDIDELIISGQKRI